VTAIEITQPGVYDIPADAYHADPVPGGSLSSSGVRLLLPPSCPALYRWQQDHPAEPRREFDFGHAAHQLVLGVGPEIDVVPAQNWRTKAARERRDAAYAEGRVPLLENEYGRVVDMAKALRAHPLASALLTPGRGEPEQSLFWQDEQTGVWCRARLDWLPHPSAGRLIVPDYKTAISANPRTLRKAFYDHGYHLQADWYLNAVAALGLAEADRTAFAFIVQEKTPPYPVTVAQPDIAAMVSAYEDNRRALEVYAKCVRDDRWPSYIEDDGDPVLIPLPPWAGRHDPAW
jgi:hypothetical protein